MGWHGSLNVENLSKNGIMGKAGQQEHSISLKIIVHFVWFSIKQHCHGGNSGPASKCPPLQPLHKCNKNRQDIKIRRCGWNLLWSIHFFRKWNWMKEGTKGDIQGSQVGRNCAHEPWPRWCLVWSILHIFSSRLLLSSPESQNTRHAAMYEMGTFATCKGS